jgi:hypothetical protein
MSDSGKKASDNWGSSSSPSSQSYGLNKKCFYDNGSYQLSGFSFVCGGNKKTISLWYKSNNNTNLSYVMYGTSNFMNIQISNSRSSHLNFIYPNYTYYGTLPESGTWNHLTSVIDGDLLSAYTYINGEYKDVGTITNGVCPSTLEFLKDSFNGYIMDIRMYCYALTPNEIKNIYNNGYGSLL